MCELSACCLVSITIPTLALHLPKLCGHLLRGEQYKCNQMAFRMRTVAENSASIALDHMSITLNLHELEYLLLNLTSLANQMTRYILAEADVSAYLQSAAGATTFVPPKESACLFVQYDVLFEEIKDTCDRGRVCVFVNLNIFVCARK